jgi:DNA-binding beta-propeller fold protein YncE
MGGIHGGSVVKKGFYFALIFAMAFSVFACMSPDTIGDQFPLRDPGTVKELWIVEGLSETVSVVNLTRRMNGMTPHTVSPLFLAGRWPNSLVIHEGKGYIVNSGANSITIFSIENPHDRREVSLFPNANPWGIALFRRGEILRALVTCAMNRSLAVLRIEGKGAWLESVVPLTYRWPQGIMTDGNHAWIAMSGSNLWGGYEDGYVTIVDISAEDVADWYETAHLPVAMNPQAIILDAIAGEAYVLSSGVLDWDTGIMAEPGGLAVFDVSDFTLKRECTLSEWTQAFVVDQAAGEVYITGGNFITGENYIFCYDSSTLAKKTHKIFSGFPADANIFDLALDEDDGFLFAADFANNRILVYDPSRDIFVDPISCGDGPLALALTKINVP